MALGWFIYAVAITYKRDLVAPDDAFISFQYARNLARGYGLVFNQGERVWGFTSPLQTLVLGLLTFAGCATEQAAFITGFLHVAIAAVLLYFLLLRFLPRVLAMGLAIAFLLDPSQHGSYTLESNFLVVSQLLFLLAATTDRARLANVLAAVSCLIRPDSLLLALPILLARRNIRKAGAIIWFVAIGVIWEAFALLYYQEILPNSFHAKNGITHFFPFFKSAFADITGVSFYLRPAFSFDLSAAGRSLVVVLACLSLLNSHLRQRLVYFYALLLYPWILVVAYSFIGSFPDHTWEFYSARFFLRLAAGVGLLSVGNLIGERLHIQSSVRWFAAASICIFFLANGVFRTAGMNKASASRDQSYWMGARQRTYRQIAAWVNENLPANPTIAMSEVGTFAYYSNAKVVDVGGIVTRGRVPRERINYAGFMTRFSPAYALVYGDHSEMRLTPSRNYRRVVYFANQGFEDFSLLAAECPQPNHVAPPKHPGAPATSVPRHTLSTPRWPSCAGTDSWWPRSTTAASNEGRAGRRPRPRSRHSWPGWRARALPRAAESGDTRVGSNVRRRSCLDNRAHPEGAFT